MRPAAAGADATAAVASPGDYVELNYTVSLDDGTVVDSSEAAGEQACFVLGGCVARDTMCPHQLAISALPVLFLPRALMMPGTLAWASAYG